MAFEDFEIQEDSLVPVGQDEVDETTLVPVGVRPKKPTKNKQLPVEKRQVFSPKLPEQPFGKGTFKFETAPFRETPESYALRSTEKLSGPERLRREEMLATKRGQQLKSLRQATPVEAKELESAQAEQDIYDKFGPMAYATRKGIFKLFKGTVEPFTQSAEEFQAIPGDVGSLLQGGISELGQRQESRDRVRRLEIDRYVVKGRESLFEKALPSIIEAGGQLLLNPRAPRQVEGFRPPPDLKAPPVPRELPPANLQGSGYRSTPPGPVYTPSPTGMEFALIPSLRPGKSPAMIVPDWVMRVAIQGDDSNTGGVNIGFEELPSIVEDIQLSGATPQQKAEAISQLDRAYQSAKREGVTSLSLLNHAFDRQTLSTVLPHETFHAGQRAAAAEGDPANLYDPDWASNLPVIKTLLENNPQLGESLQTMGPQPPAVRMAVELPAEVFGGTGHIYFETTADAIDHVFDNLMHIADRNGIEALDTIERVATIREGMEDTIPLARSMYENWQRERNARLISGAITDTPRLGELRGLTEGLQGSQGGGLEPRSGEARAASFSSTVDRGSQEPAPVFYSQLERVVADKFPEKMAPEQAVSMLLDPKYGIKKEEYDFTGLDDLIARSAVLGKPIAKEELLDWVRTNQVKVGEVKYGGNDDPNLQYLRDDIAEGRVQLDELRMEKQDLESMIDNALATDDHQTFVELTERVNENRQETIQLKERVQELESQIKSGDIATRYNTYQALKGGTPGTYRELLLTVPTKPEDLQSMQESGWNIAGGGDSANFYGGHFSEPNIVVHTRLDEGVDAEGNKVLRIQEIQSDWHQQGREKGYRTPEDARELENVRLELEDAMDKGIVQTEAGNFVYKTGIGGADEKRIAELRSKRNELMNRIDSGVPDAPFKNTWLDLAFKRLIRWAADKGYQRIVWTTGAQQIDLYDSATRQNVAKINWESDLDGINLYPVRADDPLGGGAYHQGLQRLTPKKLREYVGSAIADKILSEIDDHMGRGTVEGPDLSIGGQVHKLLYDQKLPQIARDYAKKFGGNTGKTQVRVDSNDTSVVPREPVTTEVHYLDISPKLSQTATREGFRLFSKTNLGDLVKVKGYSQSAEVVGEGEEPGTMKVKFPDGTVDEFDVNDLKQKGKRMKDPMVAQLQQNPPGPPPDLSGETYGPRTPLRVPSIATSYQEAIANKFVDLLMQEKLDVDIADPPSKQIYEALVSGELRDELVDEVLKEEGVTWEQFIQDQMQSYSKAGRDLSILSRLERDLERMLKQDPVKFGKYVAPQKQMDVILRVLNRSVLGRNLWSRYGGLIQKMVLTKLTTALVNTRTTVARAAVDAASEGLGAWMQNMSEGQGKFWDRVKESKDDAIEAMAASYEIVKALNPGQLEALINRNKRTAYQQQQEIITQLEKFFPEIHAKLFARPISGENQQRVDAEKYVHLANSLLPRVRNASTRRDMKNQIRVIEKRMQFEKSILGKTTLRGPEIAYDTMLIPLQFAEFLFRRPKFIGRLRLELMDRGIELDEVLRQTELKPDELQNIPLKQRMAFKDIPEEAIKSALNNTLELTYAYDPSTDKEAPIMERAAGYFIKTMNALGPGAILGELFPRAIYNGMKTLYEYSPAPFLTATPELMFGSKGKSPIAKILRPTYEEDPKTKTKYKAHPPTRYDWERLSKAMIGSMLLFVAWDMIREGEIGDEWWQLGDPKKKNAEGQSTYYDVRRDRPFSEYFHLASLAERYRRGTVGDKQLGNELLEIYTGIRRTDASPDFLDTINAAGELFGASPQSSGRKLAMIESGGRTLAIPFTPLLNLRDMWAIYSEEENRLKDTRGIWYGPIQDKFPWWRRSLPDLTSPIEPGPILISKDPDLLMTTGMQLTDGPNFAGREWQRLGLNYKNFLERDPDPSMNRAQNVYFEREVRRVGDMFENLPYYQDADDATKGAIWEQVIGGDNGLASQAQQFATLANPMEAEARKLQGRMPGRLQRKKFGLDKILQGIRELGEERR
jgi:hypothetical protein